MRSLAALGEETPQALAVIRLIAITGFRLNEAQGLQREWFDAESRVVLFADTKSDAQPRAIGKSAVALIGRELERGGGHHVFPAERSNGHFRQAPDVLVRICAAAQLEGVTAHTLRHTFGSVAGDLGFSELTIAAMLGHGKRGVTQGYIHIDEGLRFAVECTSEKAAELLDGRADRIRSRTSSPATDRLKSADAAARDFLAGERARNDVAGA